MKPLFILIISICSVLSGWAQEDRFYIRTVPNYPNIPTIQNDSVVTYTGADSTLQSLFNKHQVKVFRKGFKYAKSSKLKHTYFVVAASPQFQKELAAYATVFELSESITSELLKVYEPNDYGMTSTLGKAMGAKAVLDYYDFIGLPMAWYYTTGDPEIKIGLSDASIDSNDPEFKGKTTVLRPSREADGHGMSVAATLAARGDNGYGIAGVCYDCSLLTTSYGDFRNLSQLLELSQQGAKVINCSWGASVRYETAQETINEIYNNGTVIVAASHNQPFNKTKGLQPRYPAAYDHVISVGAVQHRFDTLEESLAIEEKNGKFYAANLKYHLARTGGFTNNVPQLSNLFSYTSSTSNLDAHVDLVAPGNFIFRYGTYAKDQTIDYNPYSATSPAAPLVAGTVALMFAINPCLSPDEIETILKLTSTNIDAIPQNSPFKGLYGAGSLHAGRAVKMVHGLSDDNAFINIENQSFSRWNFAISAASQIAITNQTFSKEAQAHFTAKNTIILKEDTLLLPSKNGSILLEINPMASYACDD